MVDFLATAAAIAKANRRDLRESVVPREKRSTGLGLFDTGFGLAWFLGSAAMGFLYDWSRTALIVFSVGLQLAALPILILAKRRGSESVLATIESESVLNSALRAA